MQHGPMTAMNRRRFVASFAGMIALCGLPSDYSWAPKPRSIYPVNTPPKFPDPEDSVTWETSDDLDRDAATGMRIEHRYFKISRSHDGAVLRNAHHCVFDMQEIEGAGFVFV